MRVPAAFPRFPLYGAAALIALSMLAAGLSRQFASHGTPDASRPLVVRDLRFEDRADGGVGVYLVGQAQPIEIVSPGTGGFLRATMRGLANARKRQDAELAAPFRLTAWADGRLTLDDLANGRRIDLEAFGATNEQAFARLLTAEPATP